MKKKEYFLIIDTETCNTVEQPIPYDIGYVITDRKGNIVVSHSFVVAEVFCDMSDVMEAAFYAKKIPMYRKDIRNGKRELRSLWTIRKTMLDEIKQYNITKVCAYNMGFDKRALNNLIRYVTKSYRRYWFPYNMEYICIWNMCCNSILNRPSYIKFAIENDLISESNNIFTSAECAYRYYTKDIDFIESHTGLEDVLIELELMLYCFNQHKPLETEIKPSCWRIVQKKRKELNL